jgi:hypothetical protein
MTRPDALPAEAVRDLVGIARAMHAARKRDGAPEPELEELVAIGKKLKHALALARRTGPNTLGHRAAWANAEDATSRLVRLVDLATPAAELVEAAAIRVRQIRPRPSPSDEKRAAQRRRG